MKEKIKEIFVWIKNYLLLLGSLGSLVVGIKVGWDIIKGGIAKMTPNILQGIATGLLFSLSIALFILWVRLREGLLKSKLKEKTKQYDGLFERVKLPKTLDKAITVEINPKWNKTHRQPIISSIDNKPPQLYFDMRVINRTYHSFEAEEAIVKCLCDGEEVCEKGTWDRKTRVSETFDRVEDLSKFDDGDIVFHAPIKKLYGNLKKWELEGTVKYRSKEPLIYDNQYANPEIDIHLEYVLSEKQISELKKEVEKALGDEV